jgi:hypothetical protein
MRIAMRTAAIATATAMLNARLVVTTYARI